MVEGHKEGNGSHGVHSELVKCIGVLAEKNRSIIHRVTLLHREIDRLES